MGRLSSKNLDAETYKKNSSLHFSLAEKTLDFHRFQGSEVVLDIGCGDGKITALMNQRVPQGFVEGRDPSESMISLARKDHPQVEFQVQTAEDLSEESSYDLITAFSCLHLDGLSGGGPEKNEPSSENKGQASHPPLSHRVPLLPST